jgi:hypothetical protein
MGLRLWRTLRIAPGVRLNFSKSGVSTSFGPRGAHFTIGPGGTRTTVGIPGTGLYWTQANNSPQLPTSYRSVASRIGPWVGWLLIGFFVVVALLMYSASANQSSTANVSGASPDPMPAVENVASISATRANCRSEPSKSAPVSRHLARGAEVRILEQSDTWSHVRTETAECWVASSLLAHAQPDGVPSRPPSQTAMMPVPADAKPQNLPVHYRNCADARAAGAAPIQAGEPGYSARLDRDGDGVACE